ncbi:MAG: FTR1 family protein [Thermodesulfobacteriota bacterium]
MRVKIIFKIAKISATAFLLAFLAFAISSPVFSADKNPQAAVDGISIALDAAIKSYEQGDPVVAKAKISDAYFNIFEGSGMEQDIAARINEERKISHERMFSELRLGVTAKKPIDEIVEKKNSLILELRKDAVTLEKTAGGSSPLFLNAFVIILREGFEAILIISALTAYLRKTNRQGKIRSIYAASLLALAASLLTALVLTFVIKVSGRGREAVEGLTMLFASVVLFYVSYWLISKARAEKWHAYIKERVESSVVKQGVFALGLTAFLAVYREGAETVLFYQALYAGSHGNAWPIASGFIAGAFVLAIVFILIRFFALRVPQRFFFLVTSALLYYLAFVFAGKGVLELQEAGWLSATPAWNLPAIDIFGFYPTMEGMAIQSVFLAFLLFAICFIGIRRNMVRKGVI